uniref:Toxin CcdB n=1 Tax=Candidatus Kentrum sp. FW TaxID=2126338 RepID=A0A450U299_9GAMM|nr:MAG: toxin CcdB [Candidatus Kentron sp. FW]
MTQFVVYENRNQNSREAYPYVVDVQNNLLDSLNSRLVIPLTSYGHWGDLNISNLCPIITIDDVRYVLLTHQMTTVPVSALKTPVTSLDHYRDDIVSAIDFLVTGI